MANISYTILDISNKDLLNFFSEKHRLNNVDRKLYIDGEVFLHLNKLDLLL